MVSNVLIVTVKITDTCPLMDNVYALMDSMMMELVLLVSNVHIIVIPVKCKVLKLSVLLVVVTELWTITLHVSVKMDIMMILNVLAQYVTINVLLVPILLNVPIVLPTDLIPVSHRVDVHPDIMITVLTVLLVHNVVTNVKPVPDVMVLVTLVLLTEPVLQLVTVLMDIILLVNNVLNVLINVTLVNLSMPVTIVPTKTDSLHIVTVSQDTGLLTMLKIPTVILVILNV
jgi:hypothetical protein